MDVQRFLTDGFDATDAASLILRLALGMFFASSGFHKAFFPSRRAVLKETFTRDGVYHPAMMVLIPAGELLGGLGLFFGVLTIPACVGLIVICLGACLVDGLGRIKPTPPDTLSAADYVAHILYLPEVLYVFAMVALILIGPGAYSGDALLWG